MTAVLEFYQCSWSIRLLFRRPRFIRISGRIPVPSVVLFVVILYVL
jgi:hypothetical protein